MDCAELYGGFYTDEVVGQAIKGLEREDLFIADKLWKTSVGNGLVKPTVEKMLEKLGTQYLDMLYIHAPWPDIPWAEAIPQIDELIDSDIVRHFAVSNFTVADIQKAQKAASHPIVANQMNYNVLHQNEVEGELRHFCQQENITLIAYQPIKRGEVTENETIIDIANKHDSTPAQIALAWLIAQNTLPIPKATNKQHIDENLGALNFKLEKEEIKKLKDLSSS